MASPNDHLAGGGKPDEGGRDRPVRGSPAMAPGAADPARRRVPSLGRTRAFGPLAVRVTEKNATLGVRPADVLAADMAAPRAFTPAPERGDGPYTINWVTTPSTGGSGGHTTMFRIIEHLVANGHRCRIYLYDIGGGHT